LLDDDRVEAATKAAQEAVDLFRSLPLGDPDRTSLEYASALMELGVAIRRAGDSQTTWDCYQEALSLLNTADGIDSLNLKALIQSNSANLIGDAGNLAASVAFLRDAIGTWTEVRRRAGPGAAREELVMAHKAMFNQLLKIGSYPAACAESERVLPMLTQMVNEGREDLRHELAKLWGARAMLLKKLGDFESSIDAFTQSAAIFKTSASRHQQPLIDGAAQLMQRQADYVKDLAAMRVEDAAQWAARAEEVVRNSTQMSRSGDTFHGSEQIDDAIIIYSLLVSRQPNRRWLQALAETHLSRAVMSMHAHRDAAAEQSFRASLESYDRLIQDFRQPDQLENWGRSCLGLATFLKVMDRSAECDELMSSAHVRMRSLGKAKYGQWQRNADEVLNRL
jgi:tetratricopeptide (TPR) repeat protein